MTPAGTGRLLGVAALVLAAEAGTCAWLGPPGERLRWFVNTLAVQGILVAIAGSFLLVDAPFAAARAVRRAAGRGEGGAGRPDRGLRRPWGLALLIAGGALFGGAALIWSVGTGG